jgi:hypothetical protein
VVGELVADSMYQQGRINSDETPIGFSKNTSIQIGFSKNTSIQNLNISQPKLKHLAIYKNNKIISKSY